MRIEEEPIFQPDLLCANNSEASGGIMIDKVVRSNAPMIEIRVETSPELELECPPVNCDPEPVEVLKKCDSTSSLLMNT
jgi:hypothetical protein